MQLPYFWDEAWSYFPAIKNMAETGPSLLPGAIPIELGKGHPQFFFFIASSWMRLTGGNIGAMRLLPVLISILLLLSIYFNIKKIFNQQAALIAVSLISVQSLFLAQSSLLLPEMLLALFLVCSLFAFHRKKYGQYAIYSTLMVLTKETGLIFAIIFGVFYLFQFLIKRKNKITFEWKTLLYLMIPGLIYGLFLLLHYQQFHTLFYNEHLGHIDLSLLALKTKMNAAISVIFSQSGRLLISLIFMAAFFILLFKRKKISHPAFFAIVATQVVAFITFSIFNFFTLRYMLGLMVLFIIVFAAIVSQIDINKYIKASVLTLVGGVCLFYSLTHKKNSDADLGYAEVVKLHRDMVHFCEKNGYFDSPIAASFNLLFALKDQSLGYKETQNPFTNVQDWKHVQDVTYFIYESTFDENDASVKYAKENFKLVKSFQDKHAWGYIYEKGK